MRLLMRRAVAATSAAVIVAATFGPATAPAVAHFCATPVRVPVGESASVNVGVDNDGESPVTRVEIHVPDGFELDRVVTAAPWESSRAGGEVTVTGGEILLGTCAYVGLVGTATRRGILRIPVTTHATDGTVRRFRGDDISEPLPAQLVYAGVEVPTIDTGGGAAGTSWVVVVLGTLAVVGGLAGFFAFLVRGGYMAMPGRSGHAPPSRRSPQTGRRRPPAPRKPSRSPKARRR